MQTFAFDEVLRKFPSSQVTWFTSSVRINSFVRDFWDMYPSLPLDCEVQGALNFYSGCLYSRAMPGNLYVVLPVWRRATSRVAVFSTSDA